MEYLNEIQHDKHKGDIICYYAFTINIAKEFFFYRLLVFDVFKQKLHLISLSTYMYNVFHLKKLEIFKSVLFITKT